MGGVGKKGCSLPGTFETGESVCGGGTRCGMRNRSSSRPVSLGSGCNTPGWRRWQGTNMFVGGVCDGSETLSG